MRRSGSLLIPLTLITMYYGFWTGVVIFLSSRYAALGEYLPMGGVEDLAQLLNRELLPLQQEQDTHPGRVGQGLEDPLQGGGRHDEL